MEEIKPQANRILIVTVRVGFCSSMVGLNLYWDNIEENLDSSYPGKFSIWMIAISVGNDLLQRTHNI